MTDNSIAQALPQTQRSARARDLRAVAAAGIGVVLVLALFGQLGWVAAVAGACAIAGAGALWFYGTSNAAEVLADDPDAAMLAARRLAEQEKAFRVALVQALPEPAVYIDAQGRVEAANSSARKAFRFVGAEPQLTAVVRRPELLDAVADGVPPRPETAVAPPHTRGRR